MTTSKAHRTVHRSRPISPDTAPTGDPVPSRRGPKRILLVDDDPGVRSSLGAVLQHEGYGVLPAANGLEALQLAAVGSVDLTVLDLNMPIKNGWDTFERLSWEHPLMPIIVITARSNQLFTALGAGVGALLEKPLEIPLFLHTVARLLAEPGETRLARLSGHTTEFTYAPRRALTDTPSPPAR